MYHRPFVESHVSSENDSVVVQRVNEQIKKNDQAYESCKNATPQKVEFYKLCLPENSDEPFVNIEGPEFDQDYSFFNFGLCKGLYKRLELGIPIVPLDYEFGTSKQTISET